MNKPVSIFCKKILGNIYPSAKLLWSFINDFEGSFIAVDHFKIVFSLISDRGTNDLVQELRQGEKVTFCFVSLCTPNLVSILIALKNAKEYIKGYKTNRCDLI